jgi:Smg protein
MKENVFDVLMYLFENYMDEDPAISQDQESLTTELTEAGFPRREISKAFSWLEGLSNLRQQEAAPLQQRVPGSLRYYSEQEKAKISAGCRGFILAMEQRGVLDSKMREMVIDRIMALGTEEIELEQVKWIILLVLFNQPGQEQAYNAFEDMVFEQSARPLH